MTEREHCEKTARDLLLQGQLWTKDLADAFERERAVARAEGYQDGVEAAAQVAEVEQSAWESIAAMDVPSERDSYARGVDACRKVARAIRTLKETKR